MSRVSEVCDGMVRNTVRSLISNSCANARVKIERSSEPPFSTASINSRARSFFFTVDSPLCCVGTTSASPVLLCRRLPFGVTEEVYSIGKALFRMKTLTQILKTAGCFFYHDEFLVFNVLAFP